MKLDLTEKIKVFRNALTSREYYTGYSLPLGLQGGEPTMYDIYLWLLHDPDFSLAVEQFADLSVGGGYYNSIAGTAEPKGTAKDALKLIDDMAEDIDLDRWTYDTTIESWAFGNSFSTPTWDGNIISELDILPIASMRDITTDQNNKPTTYIQDLQYRIRPIYRTNWDNTSISGLKKTPAESILHFAIRRLNASAWGEGLGQLQSRPGRGYKAQGKNRRRNSIFQNREMFADSRTQIYYHMQPRTVAITKGDPASQQKVKEALAQSDPGSMIASSAIEDIKTISLDTTSKFQDMHNALDKESATANMTGINRIMDPSQTSFAASETTRRAQLPFVDSFRRRLKRFIEQNIYRPVIEAEFKDWKKYRVELSWEPQEAKGLDYWDKIARMVTDVPQLAARIDWDELIKSMNNDGVDIQRGKQDVKAVSREVENAIREKKLKKAASEEKYNDLIDKMLGDYS